MESEVYCDDYYVSDPGDETASVFDYFKYHKSSQPLASDYIDETDEE